MFLSKTVIHSCMTIHYIVEENIFGRYCLQAFRAAENLKCYIKYCFKINGKQRIETSKKATTLDSKIMKER